MLDRVRSGTPVCAVANLVALSLLLSSVVLSQSASAGCAIPASSYDEGIDGDLPSPPLALDLGIGRNRIRGSVGGGVDDFDDFSFTIEPGDELNRVILEHLAGLPGTGSNAVRFFTGTDTGAPPPAFLGEADMTPAQVGADYLELVGIGPQGPDVYSISIVNTLNPVQQYDFALDVGTRYDEGVDGDLPSSPSTPPLALELGCVDNQVLGSIGGGVDGFDRFSFTIESGDELKSVILEQFTGTGGNAVRFFTGTDTGAPPPAFLGETNMTPAQVGADYLEVVGIGPLGPGQYSIAIVNTSSPEQQYGFTLAVPEPRPAGAALAAAVGLAVVGLVQRARQPYR